MRRLAGALLAALLACGGGSPPEDSDAAAPDSAALPAPPVDPDPPAEPAAPPGYLAVRSAGEISVNGAWPARAGRCTSPAIVHVVVDDAAIGLIILVQFADSEAVGSFAVRSVVQGLPHPPAAQVGVQLIGDPETQGLHAISGDIELTAVGSGRVSGRFAGQLVEVSSRVRIGLSAAFTDVPVTPVPEAECALAATVVDTSDTTTP